MIRTRLPLAAVLVSLSVAACDKEKPAEGENLAPLASSLEAPKPASSTGSALAIETGTSKMQFLMDSPLEKIHGEAPSSVSGELSVELDDLGKTTGLVKVDLDKLTLYQEKRADENSAYGERKKSEKQNEHARDWLQIVPHEGEVSAEQAAANRMAEFRIDKVEPSVANVLGMSGAERKVNATVSGELRVHGRTAPATAKVELVFRFAGDRLESLAVKTVEPLSVSLEKYEIHPRDAAGKFVKTVTDAVTGSLKGKIQSSAPVQIELVAKPK